MQCNELELEQPKLSNLDKALDELGMLANSAHSRNEFLKDIKYDRNPYLNMLTINTRYVSNVSIGFKVRPTAPHTRYTPYFNVREKRYRTKSEHSDSDISSFVKPIVENCLKQSLQDISNLKKAKSLESIVTEETYPTLDEISIKTFPELEVVSDSIQNLKVAE